VNATSVWDVNSVHGAFKQQFQGQPHTDFPHASADHRKDASDAQVRAVADDRVQFMDMHGRQDKLDNQGTSVAVGASQKTLVMHILIPYNAMNR
jgi:hypothetical protein